MILNDDFKSVFFVNSRVHSYEGGSIKGKVIAQGIKYPCKVSVYDRLSRQLIETKETNMLGDYTFENLTFGLIFFVLATDPAKQYNAVIQDMVVPK